MEHVNWSPDKANSISSATGRLVTDGARAVQVQPTSTSKTQIAALMDLLDLHLSGVEGGQPVDPDRVVLRAPALRSEAQGALGTLIDVLATGPSVEVLQQDTAGVWGPAEVGWNLADVSEYEGWPDLLARPRVVPALVSDIVQAAGLPALRAYPMLSTEDSWSLRIEGLEVGRATARRVTLKVGKDSKAGNRSFQRKAWIDATGHDAPFRTDSFAEAAEVISSFCAKWQGLRVTSDKQDEHALESRILRGATPITVQGQTLSLIQPDPAVNWGSQFPTKWGPGGKARYLDALLRDGSTPWAIEMKVQGGAGVGQYYRHAVAQAVLYREFIRRAVPLHPWFENRGLNAPDCRAAVVVPEIPAKQSQWRVRVERLCEVFDVAFVEVDPQHARRH